MPNPWLKSRLPPGPAAALAALHFAEPAHDILAKLSESEWRDALQFCNRSQLTLALRDRVRDAMPAWVRDVTDQNHAHNLERLKVVQDLYRSVSERLDSVGIEFVALKGLTQCPLFGSQPESRPQYDIDLYCPRNTAPAAQDALMALGFEPMEGMKRFPTDHLPALIRKTGWQYRGDVFDPEMPLAAELHFQFWNGNLERLEAPGVEAFWDRRVVREMVNLPALAPPDALAYACLHLLKHVLRGSARPFHAYEIACFLNLRANDLEFWAEWRSLHAPGLRRLQAVAFRLAREWFGPTLGPAETEVSQLPPVVSDWFDQFALSPALTPFNSNKDELWLHVGLLESRRDKLVVIRRRLLPQRLPPPVDSVYVPDSEMTWRSSLRKRARWIAYLTSRLRHHALGLPGVLWSGVRWWRGMRPT